MRVFILNTGRCGSNAFIEACQHITNFTAAHESNANCFGKKRFIYPDDHIEADNRLSWDLGNLNNIYGKDAFYVHLKRNRDAVAASFMKRFYQPKSLIDAYCEGIRMTVPEAMSEKERLSACYDYIDTVNNNIDFFLLDKPLKLDVHIENIKGDFLVFWKKIGAEGDLDSALNEFEKEHNASRDKDIDFLYRFKVFAIKQRRHLLSQLKKI